jgi:inosine-uridine nucleoside N-ribohydrolase
MNYRNSLFTNVALALFLNFFAACSDDDNSAASSAKSEKNEKDIPTIILDTDIGSSTDDLFALQSLYRCHQAKTCNFIGVIVDRMGENNAAITDVMNTYYGMGDLPIGLERNGIKEPKVWIDYAELPADTNADGSEMFKRTVKDYSKVLDGYKLYRKLLAEQPDHSVNIVSIGFVTTLANLLNSKADDYSNLSGVELVKAKVKTLYVMGGVFGDAVEPDYNFTQAIDFSLDFFKLWPVEVPRVFSPGEVGDGIEYVPEQVIEDISWTDTHPIKQVYMNNECHTGQKMWDVMAVLNAVQGDSLFQFSDNGRVSIDEKGITPFTKDAKGNDRYQRPNDTEWNNRILQEIRKETKEH